MRKFFGVALAAALVIGAGGGAKALQLGGDGILVVGETGSFSQLHSPESFTDDWLFVVTTSAAISSLVVDFNPLPPLPPFNITAFGLSLWEDDAVDVQVATGVVVEVDKKISLVYSSLSSIKNYYLRVTGTAEIPSGFYVGSYTIGRATTGGGGGEVPIPAALPLLGAGLAALGIFARRRRLAAA